MPGVPVNKRDITASFAARTVLIGGILEIVAPGNIDLCAAAIVRI